MKAETLDKGRRDEPVGIPEGGSERLRVGRGEGIGQFPEVQDDLSAGHAPNHIDSVGTAKVEIRRPGGFLAIA